MKRTLIWLLTISLLLGVIGLPMAQAEEPVTLKILRFYSPIDLYADHSYEVIQETTGYKLEFDTLPNENWLDQLSLMFAAGDYDYDYIRFAANEESKNLFNTLASRGLLADLTDKLPNYENLMNLDPRLLNTLTVDGKIYAICSSALALTNPNNMVRMDWLDACGIKAPTNREEFYQMLKAFKEKDPDGLGDQLIPFVAQATDMVATISATFGILYPYEDRDGKIVYTRLTPEYKDYLTFMHQLYEEGLLDPDFAINTGVTVSEKVVSGRVGYYAGWVDDASNFLTAMKAEGIEDKKIYAIEPLIGDDGNQRLRSGHNGQGLSEINVIPASSTKVDQVLDFLNKCMEPETFQFLIHGEEGVTYTVEDGVRKPTADFQELRGNMHEYMPLQDGVAYFDLWQLRTRKNPNYEEVAKTIFATAEGHIEWPILGFAPAFPDVSTKVSMVSEHAVQEATKFIAGARSLDTFDAFVQEMIDLGANNVVDAYNGWYLSK